MKCECGHLKESHFDEGPCIAWGYENQEDGSTWVCACKSFQRKAA